MDFYILIMNKNIFFIFRSREHMEIVCKKKNILMLI